MVHAINANILTISKVVDVTHVLISKEE